MRLSRFQSVLDEGFVEELQAFAPTLPQYFATLLRASSDPIAVRTALGALVPNDHIRIRLRYLREPASSVISTFRGNQLIMPVCGTGRARVTTYASDDGRPTGGVNHDVASGEAALIDASHAFFSIDHLSAGLYLEAEDKVRPPFVQHFSRASYRLLGVAPTNFRDNHLKYACKLLTNLPSEGSKTALLRLTSYRVEEVRWLALRSYCAISSRAESIAALTNMKLHDKSQKLRNLAGNTLNRNTVQS